MECCFCGIEKMIRKIFDSFENFQGEWKVIQLMAWLDALENTSPKKNIE